MGVTSAVSKTDMKHLLTIISCFAVLSISAQVCNATVTSGNESPCWDAAWPCCTALGACNGPNTACNNYDPDFSATGGCDLSCVGVVCFDEEACNYGSAEECWYAEAGFDCEGYCLIDIDGDGDLESEVCCGSIGLEFWGDVEGGIHPAENSVVQGIQAEVEFVLNIPSTVQDGATGTPYAVSQFVIEEATGWPSWAEVIELDGDTLEAMEQICVPISGIPVSEGTYEVSISGTYTVLIFDLPFEIGAVEYSASIHVEANPDPVEGCTYELAFNFLPYATLDDGSCEFEGCADQTALNYIPYGNSFDFCVYAESICGIGLVWDDLLQTCVPSVEFVEALQINACGEGTYWNEELGICLPIDECCPEDLDGDGLITVTDLLQLLSAFAEECSPADVVNGILFDSSSGADLYVVQDCITGFVIELWGTSGGAGGDVCGQTIGASSCNLCDATGGAGGDAVKITFEIGYLFPGDELQVIQGQAGLQGEISVCNPGLEGWTGWDCGPSPNGGNGGLTSLLINGEPFAEIQGGTGGTGACIGCQGDGCFNGDPGESGSLEFLSPLAVFVSSEFLEGTTGGGMIITTQ